LSDSLTTRDLSTLVKPEDIITSEHLTTLLAVVPKYSQKDWLSSYEFFDTFVVSLKIPGIHSSSVILVTNCILNYLQTVLSISAISYSTLMLFFALMLILP
jgi:hypothetical protein